MKEHVVDTLIDKAHRAINDQLRQSIHQYLTDSLSFYIQDSDVDKLSKISDNYNVVCKPCTIIENNDGSITINIHPLDFKLSQNMECTNNAD